MQRPGRPGLRGADSDATVTPGRRPCRRGVQAGRAGIRPGGAVRLEPADRAADCGPRPALGRHRRARACRRHVTWASASRRQRGVELRGGPLGAGPMLKPSAASVGKGALEWSCHGNISRQNLQCRRWLGRARTLRPSESPAAESRSSARGRHSRPSCSRPVARARRRRGSGRGSLVRAAPGGPCPWGFTQAAEPCYASVESSRAGWPCAPPLPFREKGMRGGGERERGGGADGGWPCVPSPMLAQSACGRPSSSES